jgi:signal transduction histidine kinase
MFQDRVLGVIQVLNGKERPFQESDLKSLEDMSRMVGYALYHAKVYDDLATMKKLETEKAKFMRVMVHELKSPVAASIMMIEVLKNYKPNPEQTVSMTGRLADRLEQMSQLIGDILELAQIKSGTPLGEISELDIVAETRKNCESFQDQAQEKGLQLEVALPEEPLHVRFDSKGFSLVLSNLIGNAVKYTEKGLVKVDLSRQNGWAVIDVSDTGMGIPESDIPKLFEEFFRASNAKKSKIPGSGVGLAGVKNIIERFGGQMELESRENEGSTFTVRLPLYKENITG